MAMNGPLVLSVLTGIIWLCRNIEWSTSRNQILSFGHVVMMNGPQLLSNMSFMRAGCEDLSSPVSDV